VLHEYVTPLNGHKAMTLQLDERGAKLLGLTDKDRVGAAPAPAPAAAEKPKAKRGRPPLNKAVEADNKTAAN
jgi:hypothetical protein